MSCNSFMNNFSYGFMTGLFGYSPYFGCGCMGTGLDSSMFLVHNINTCYYPLLPPTLPPPPLSSAFNTGGFSIWA